MEQRSSDEPAPVAQHERLYVLDLVRGVALLGILIMNMPGFATSFYSGLSGSDLWANWWDEWTATLRNVLFSGKFNSMFSLLFGIGFTIQLERLLERKGSAGIQIYLRRLIALLLFGAVHMLIFWTGDVLHMYAILGMLLVLLRNRSDRAIFALIVLTLLFPIGLGVFKIVMIDMTYLDHMGEAFSAWLTSNNAAYGRGTFLEAAHEHMRETWFLYTDLASIEFTLAFYVQLMTTMLLGFLIGRHHLVQRIPELMPRIVRWQYWSCGIGIASALLLAYGERTVSPMDLSAKGIVVSMTYVICRLSLMTFYVLSLVRLVQDPLWQRRLMSIAIVGRMPLTNYLLQTAIATTIFYGWGLGFWNRGGPLSWLLLALAIYFVVQVPFSKFWLERFQYGPMEYLWRVMTYGRTMSGQLTRSSAAREIQHDR